MFLYKVQLVWKFKDINIFSKAENAVIECIITSKKSNYSGKIHEK